VLLDEFDDLDNDDNDDGDLLDNDDNDLDDFDECDEDSVDCVDSYKFESDDSELLDELLDEWEEYDCELEDTSTIGGTGS